MICKTCGANYDSNMLSCPYCGQVNEKALAKAKKLDVYDEAFQTERNRLLEEGQILVLRKITIGICLSLSIIAILFSSLTYYYEHHDYLRRRLQMSGSSYEKHLKLIHSYIDDKDYLRALTLARATDVKDDFSSYPDASEELNMILSYYLFTSYIQRYIVAQEHLDIYSFHENLEDIYLGHFLLKAPYEIYTAAASSERAVQLKE